MDVSCKLPCGVCEWMYRIGGLVHPVQCYFVLLPPPNGEIYGNTHKGINGNFMTGRTWHKVQSALFLWCPRTPSADFLRTHQQYIFYIFFSSVPYTFALVWLRYIETIFLLFVHYIIPRWFKSTEIVLTASVAMDYVGYTDRFTLQMVNNRESRKCSHVKTSSEYHCWINTDRIAASHSWICDFVCIIYIYNMLHSHSIWVWQKFTKMFFIASWKCNIYFTNSSQTMGIMLSCVVNWIILLSCSS